MIKVNIEMQNKLENLLNSRNDWNNKIFKTYILDKIDNNDLNLDELKLRYKIEGYYLGFIKPDKYLVDGTLIEKKQEVKTIDEKIPSSLGFLEDPINIEFKKTKPIVLSIDNYSELIPAIKCILWSLDNKPKTTIDLLSHIMIRTEKGVILPLLDTIEGNNYTESNNALNMAISTDLLHTHRFKNKNGKWVFLYYNPTNKRQGYFYKGELWKLKDLSEINNVKMGTIQRRFQKMSIENAIK
jgi:hypothetical protein